MNQEEKLQQDSLWWEQVDSRREYANHLRYGFGQLGSPTYEEWLANNNIGIPLGGLGGCLGSPLGMAGIGWQTGLGNDPRLQMAPMGGQALPRPRPRPRLHAHAPPAKPLPPVFAVMRTAAIVGILVTSLAVAYFLTINPAPF